MWSYKSNERCTQVTFFSNKKKRYSFEILITKFAPTKISHYNIMVHVHVYYGMQRWQKNTCMWCKLCICISVDLYCLSVMTVMQPLVKYILYIRLAHFVLYLPAVIDNAVTIRRIIIHVYMYMHY